VNGERIEGATNMEYEPDSSGLYSVKVIVSSGCVSPMSTPFNYEKTIYVEDLEQNNKLFMIYPNPSNGLIRVEINTILKTQNLVIKNLLGEEILNLQINPGKKYNDFDINILPAGVYYLQVVTFDGILTNKVIKY
jgi:hypothetical protein